MPDELIVKIIDEIINQKILGNYKFYLLVAATTFVSVAFSYFISSYFKQRGQNFATKADFEQILVQLQQTTTITESIRSSISSRSLEEINYRILLREKIELIFDETFKLELWLELARSKALTGSVPNTNESPITKIEMYQAIYFKELNAELLMLQSKYYPMMKFIFSVAADGIKGNPPNIFDGFEGVQKPLLDSLTSFRKRLLEVYAPTVGL